MFPITSDHLNGERGAGIGVQPVSPRSTRRAVYLPSQGTPLFAWLHDGTDSAAGGHGVVICAGAGYEQVHGHRSLRHLAEALADAGLLAVRFDFVGTGDSADLDPSANLYATWLANLRDVISWMRDQRGCRQISLIGLRLGATLATQVASEQAIDSLVLWEPVVRGRAYTRELQALSLTGAGEPHSADAEVEAAGFRFSNALLDEIKRVDLLTIRPLCRRALIVAREEQSPAGKLQQHLSAAGIEAELVPFLGYADMVAEPHFVKVPHGAIETTVAWLLSSPQPEVGSLSEVQNDASLPTTISLGTDSSGRRLVERFVSIHQEPDLFGIVTEPEQEENLPLIVLVNAGSTYRVGPGRLYVQLARALAACGFRCLRLDLAGLGDSVTTDTDRENDCYPATAFRDIDLTLKFVQGELGAKRVVLMGLCSGAYVAFQSAVQIANPLLVESVLINPLTFFWREGMSLESSPARDHSVFQYYKASAMQPRKWLKLFCGRTKLGILDGLKMLARRFRIMGARSPAPGTPRETQQSDPWRLGHPGVEDLSGDLRRVEQAGRHLACFFSRSDPGYSVLCSTASRLTKQLRKAGKLSIHFIDDADHTFSRQPARSALLTAVVEHLRQRYQPGCRETRSDSHQDEINGYLYNRADLVQFYTGISLSPPEALALIQYRDDVVRGRVLDLGCGAGRLAVYLRPLARHYVGLDISANMIAHCQKHFEGMEFVQGDMRSLSQIGTASFEAVFAVFNLFDAVSHEDRLQILAEVRRVLIPGGLLVFSSHNRNYVHALEGPRLHFQRNPIRQLRSLLEYLQGQLNRRRIRSRQRFEPEYALLNDSGHNFSVLHYYINRDAQAKQLRDAGFELLMCLDERGRTLGPEEDDSAYSTIHYVARLVGS